jgi:hypothetical protein
MINIEISERIRIDLNAQCFIGKSEGFVHLTKGKL